MKAINSVIDKSQTFIRNNQNMKDMVDCIIWMTDGLIAFKN